MGLHSALAIKRQRKRRDEQKKARDRRFSSQSTESGLGESRSSFASPRNSIGSIDRKHLRRFRRVYSKSGGGNSLDTKVVSSVGMLHIGVVFIVLGSFLIGSGIIPDDLEHWGKPPGGSYFNELVLAGSFALGIGIFLIILNKIITKKEEDDLTEYVQRQLTRSKSGHRLVRDVETGCLTTKRDQRAKQEEEKLTQLDTDLESITPAHFSPTLRSPPPLTVSTPRSDLERILEEELSEKGEEEQRAMERLNKEVLAMEMLNKESLDTNGLNKEALANGTAVHHTNEHNISHHHHHTPHHQHHHNNHHHHQTQPEYSIREDVFEFKDGIGDGVYETRELTTRYYNDLDI